MKVTYFPNAVSSQKTTLVLGAFESIHNGHLALIKAAEKQNKKTAVMLIENPSDLPGSSKEEYASLDVRLQQLAWIGVDFISIVKFTNDIRLMNGKDFILEIMKATKADSLVMGSDFVCGRGGEYKAKDISNDFKNSIIIEQLKFNERKISTSSLKELVTLGQVDVIKQLSPFAFEIKTNVDSKGNFRLTKEPKLHSGIYATVAEINGIAYWSYTHVSQTGNFNIQVPDLQIKNSPYDAIISFHKLVRIIVSSTKDKIEDGDIPKVANYLKNNI